MMKDLAHPQATSFSLLFPESGSDISTKCGLSKLFDELWHDNFYEASISFIRGDISGELTLKCSLICDNVRGSSSMKKRRSFRFSENVRTLSNPLDFTSLIFIGVGAIIVYIRLATPFKYFAQYTLNL